ncbi:hypothetical protein PV371_12000 [Streptomyces sp. TX20-6-3]|uniref:hypothetical protein n=1 Tax=Streptomyces sp. TX20-6-3 TaxID=3028705 RepID=UPI0029AFF408|nr:hypothetical protein [Streptomyces sp. TX20-6-3]MDX2560366.1 hypothetical protein [Streptomyces sp. TX20-6-3]
MVVQLRYGRPGARGSGAFAVTAVLVGSLVGTAAVSGCAAPEDPRPKGDPTLAVRNAPDALTKAGTSKASTSMEMAAGGTRVTIRGEGGYDFRRRTGRLQVVLPKDAAGTSEHRPITELLTPGALYMKNRGAGVPADKWVRVDTTTLDDGNLVTGGATDPAAAAELLRGARQVTYVGEVELAGVRVSHYRGVADIAHAARVAAPQLRGALAAAAKGFTTDTVPFDAYLDGEGRLRKVRHQFSFSNQGRTVAVASTTLLYGFGVPVQVTLPDRRDIYAGKIKA